MLEKIFLTVLEIGIAYSPVILILLLAAPLLGKRYSPKLRYLLWLALAVRLVIPVNMPWSNALQVELFPARQSQSAQDEWFLPNPAQILESKPEAEKEGAPLEQKPAFRQSARIAPLSLMAAVWAAGTVLFMLYHLGAYFHTLYRLRRWSTPVHDGEALRGLESAKRELSIRGEVGLYSSAKAASPLLLGFIRPRIILPEQPLTQGQLDLMLRHELWHLKRGDLWYKLLALLANAVHWFNPLVYLMDRQAGLDTELSCDADVLRKADSGERKAYGYAVLSFMEQGWRCKTPLTSNFYGGKTQMKQRFYNIADARVKKRGAALLCAAALVIALAGCAVHAAGPVEQDKQTADSASAMEQSEVQGIEEMESNFNADFVNNKKIQDEARAELDRILREIEWSKNPYTDGEMAWPFPDNTRIIDSIGVNPQTPNNVHTGIDIAGEFGDAIIAANDGTVQRVSEEWTPGAGYGMYIILDHGGEISTLYAHCSKILVSEGDSVLKGEKIAEAGATGYAFEPHLHFEVRVAGAWVDPMPYITSKGFIWPASGGYISLGLNGYPGHTGMDIAGNPEGSHVYAAAAGTVVKAVNSNVGYGKFIVIDHGNGYQTLYAHNSELYVSVGDVVAQGQTIAAVGRSGNTTGLQLHFEIRHDGKLFNPEDYLVAPDGVDSIASAQPQEYIAIGPENPENPLSYSEVERGDTADSPTYTSNQS